MFEDFQYIFRGFKAAHHKSQKYIYLRFVFPRSRFHLPKMSETCMDATKHLENWTFLCKRTMKTSYLLKINT